MSAELPAAHAAHPMPEVSPLRILVVEDQVLIAMLIEAVLQEHGYEVILAGNGEEALARAEPVERLAAVVADIHLLGRMDGKAVIRSLRRSRPGLPVVVVTGFYPEAPEADLRGLGGPTIRLRKPFVTEDLVASLADVLASRTGHAGEPSAATPGRRGRVAQDAGAPAMEVALPHR